MLNRPHTEELHLVKQFWTACRTLTMGPKARSGLLPFLWSKSTPHSESHAEGRYTVLCIRPVLRCSLGYVPAPLQSLYDLKTGQQNWVLVPLPTQQGFRC